MWPVPGVICHPFVSIRCNLQNHFKCTQFYIHVEKVRNILANDKYNFKLVDASGDGRMECMVKVLALSVMIVFFS